MLNILGIRIVVAIFVNAYLALLQRILYRHQQLCATLTSDLGASAAAAVQLLLSDGWSYKSAPWGQGPCRAKPDMTKSAMYIYIYAYIYIYTYIYIYIYIFLW